MNDPHVVWLKYNASWPADCVFSNPPAISGDLADFAYAFANDEFVATMKSHCASERDARGQVEPFLHAWALDQALVTGTPTLSFAFVISEVVDRCPPAPGEIRYVQASSTIQVEARLEAAVTLIHPAYPPPPSRFDFSSDVEMLWDRYQAYKKGREPVTSMANACLTFLEGLAGGRKPASTMFAIQFDILNRIGCWAAIKGGPLEARKLGRTATLVPLSDEERNWFDAAIRLIIRRKAEYDADPSAPLKHLAMADVK